MYDNIRKRLLKKFAPFAIYGRTTEDDGRVACSATIDMENIIRELMDERESREQSYIDAGVVMIGMLKDFLIEGVWQFGLADEDGAVISDTADWPEPTIDGGSTSWKRPNGALNPIIWFGVKGQAPIECWSITLSQRMFQTLNCYANAYGTEARPMERWKLFWFSTFWCFDWNALFDNNGDAYIVWMFAECGMDEPIGELDLIRRACPIELDGADTGAMLAKKVNSFFINKQKDAIKKSEASCETPWNIGMHGDCFFSAPAFLHLISKRRFWFILKRAVYALGVPFPAHG